MQRLKISNFYRLVYRVVRKIKRVFKRKNQQIYLKDRVKQYDGIWSAIAKKVNAEISNLDRDIWQITKGKYSIYVRLHQFPLDNSVVLKICGRKPLIHKLLSEANIPVPDFQLFDIQNITKIVSFLSKHPLGVVIKPCEGYSGLGVTTHIHTLHQLKRAATLASLYFEQLMVEAQIVGENYRLLIYKGKMLNAVRRTGQSIIGDGKSSIANILNIEHRYSLQKQDPDIVFTLASQNLSINYIPKENEKVLVRSISKKFNTNKELRTIYDFDVTQLVHPSIQQMAEDISKLIGVDLIGVDIITVDISQPLILTGGVINEINTTPALHHHYIESKEDYPQAALEIVRDLLQL